MRTTVSIGALIFIVCVSAHAAVDSELKAGFPQVYRFYSDHDFVVKNSSIEERKTILQAMLRNDTQRAPLKDARLKDVLSAMGRNRSATFSVDSRMVWGYVAVYDYSFTLVPIEITYKAKDRLILKVEKRSTSRKIPVVPLGSKSAGNRSVAMLEFDDWRLVQGTWRIWDLHVYLLGA